MKKNDNLFDALDYVIQYTQNKMGDAAIGQTQERDALHKFMDVAIRDNDWIV